MERRNVPWQLIGTVCLALAGITNVGTLYAVDPWHSGGLMLTTLTTVLYALAGAGWLNAVLYTQGSRMYQILAYTIVVLMALTVMIRLATIMTMT